MERLNDPPDCDPHDLAGQPFNLASPKQLGEIFFDKLGMPVVKKTATGARSTDEEVLEKLALDYPLPAKLLEHRSLSKLKGTYTDKLAQLALPRTGRVHTHYAQAVAVTGRLSSAEPNLQNIPIRTPEGRRIRAAFVAPPGCVLASGHSAGAVHHPEADWGGILKAYNGLRGERGFDPNRKNDADFVLRFLCANGRKELVGMHLRNLSMLADGDSDAKDTRRHVCEAVHRAMKRWMRFDIRDLRRKTRTVRIRCRFLVAQLLSALFEKYRSPA